MSFSTTVKTELAHIEPEKKCCMLAEIAGFVRMSGVIGLAGGGRMKLVMTTESPAVARHYKKLIKEYFDVEATTEVGEGSSLKKGRQYILTLDDRLDQLAEPVLRETGILLIREGKNYISDGIYQGLIKSKCCRKAYLRGLFLGSGSITDPQKSYHIEFICNTETLAGDVKKLINTFTELTPKIVERGKNHIVYLKESTQVGDMLNIMGAHGGFFELEDVRMTKEARNQANRMLNCDSANLDKTISAAAAQTAAILKIQEKKGQDYLPEKLKEAAALRLENPEASLSDLAAMTDPPLKKSGLAHRFKKIQEIAERL